MALVLGVGVLLVDQRLEVHDFDVVAVAVGRRDHRVHLARVRLVAGQQLLNRLVVEQVLLRQAQDLEGLLLRDEAPLDAQALVRHGLAALVLDLLLFYFVEVTLFLQEALHPEQAFFFRQHPNHRRLLLFRLAGQQEGRALPGARGGTRYLAFRLWLLVDAVGPGQLDR